MSRIARALRTATQVDPRATFPAVDASGAYDHVSRAAMLGPASTGGVALPLLPYGSQFYAIQSVYTWVDAHQRNHDILHCEGAEQGDPLMPGYSVAKRFSARYLACKREDQDRLLQRLPGLGDLQAAWLVLQSCAALRANYLLRILPPHLTAAYAESRDAAVARCLATLLEHDGERDTLGDYLSACATSGVLATRAGCPLSMPSRESSLTAFPCGTGLNSPETRPSCARSHGAASPTPDVQPGTAVSSAARRKRHQKYPELERARRCRLVFVGLEVGGRFGAEAVQLLGFLARHRAAAFPVQLRPSAIVAWISRWSGLLAVASQRAYAASLLELPPAAELGEGPLPELHDVLADSQSDR
eukprot:s1173_g15.t1